MGSIRQRGPRSWQLRIANGSDPETGRRRTLIETFHGTETAARLRLAELTVKASRGYVADHTLAATITEWRAQASHELATKRNYDLALRTLPKSLLRMKVRDIRAKEIRTVVNSALRDHNASRARVVHALISGALSYAWREEWIHENPARRVPLPAQPKRTKTTPTTTQVLALLEAAAGDAQLYAWLLLSADLGSRRQETLALRGANVRLDAGEVYIAGALDPIDGHHKGTKTDQARTVAIGAPTVVALRRWRVQMAERAMSVGTRLVDDPYLFSDAFDGGTPWRLDLATRRFIKLRRRAGIDGVRLYDLRHFVATTWLDAGLPTKLVAGRLGHSREAMTTDTYGAFVKASDRAAADELSRRLHS